MESWLDDLRRATAFLTRVPIPHDHDADGFLRAMRVYPLVGAAIGLAVGIVLVVLLRLNLPPVAGAALALGVGALITGALHEDGLADIADGFGGGKDKPAKLAIMRDSRLGTYGTLALVVSFAVRTAALAAIPTGSVILTLIATHALARATLPAVSLALPFARDDGLAASAGQPDPVVAAIAAGIGAIVALICLPVGTAVSAAVLVALGAAGIAWLALRQIGGVTGDVLGATEQVGEALVLLAVAARLG